MRSRKWASTLAPFNFEIRDLREWEVLIEILFFIF